MSHTSSSVVKTKRPEKIKHAKEKDNNTDGLQEYRIVRV
jgi:hypothetical protein